MLNETRVNLKHLLEDIRDSYTSPLEEVIITELIANALDSKALKIKFTVNPEQKFIRIVDDGLGMKRKQLKEYHNVAASAKTKGTGIGFAGIGAKLSLLIAERVITESKGSQKSRCATEWRMTSNYRAPWKFVPFPENIKTSRGTAVSIYFPDDQSHILQDGFVAHSVIKHFYPLLDKKIYREILRYFYKKEVTFCVNENELKIPLGDSQNKNWFNIRLGRSRHTVGIGYLVKNETGLDKINWLEKLFVKNETNSSLPPGLWISTFGKVIKGGWEWLGVMPKNADQLSGIVEIPALSEILTTNKNGFLTDAASLQKYYKYRKAIQEAVLPVFQSLGENREQVHQPPEKIIKPVNQSIKHILNNLLGDFPELESLVGSRKKTVPGQSLEKAKDKNITIPEQQQGQENGTSNPKGEIKSNKNGVDILPGFADLTKTKMVKAAQSGLKIVLDGVDNSPEMILGRIVENTLTVNTKHPAWLKAKKKGMEEYHILLTVGVVLSQFLENQKSPQEFLNRFLEVWAESENI